MTGNSQVVAALNKVLTRKLTAINQYFLHARMHRDKGFEPLNDKIYGASIDEMKHADKIIERVLFLEGLPNLQELGKLYIGEDVPEMLTLDAKMQLEDIGALREAVQICEQAGDYVSRDLLAGILSQQEEHLDWLETQQDLLEHLGTERYLQTQV